MPNSSDIELLQPNETVLNGQYTIEKHLGSGGQGQVYLARHRIFDQVAVKRLHRHIADQPEGRARFERELRITDQLRGEHVIFIRNFDRDQARDEWFSVMEYANGGSLEDKLATEAPLPITEAIQLAITLCQTLAHIHQYPYVHGDLKPSNVLFHAKPNQESIVKLSDFGSAFQPVRAGVLSLPSGLKAARTRLYVSPELLDASDPEDTEALAVDVDQRADIYAIGVILYEMLTGRPPFWESSGESDDLIVRLKREHTLLRKVKEELPPDPKRQRSEILPSLNALVMKALAKDPTDRFANVGEMHVRLEEVLKEEKGRLAELARLRPLTKRALEKKQWDQASGLLNKILDLVPDDPDASEKLKIVNDQQCLKSLQDQIPQKLDNGLLQEARYLVEQALKIAPDDAMLTTWEEEIDAQLNIIRLLEQAREAERKSDWPQIISLCREALDLNPDHTEASDLLELAKTQNRTVKLRQRADKLLDRGNYKAALEKLKRLSVLDPTNEELQVEIKELQSTLDLDTYYSQAKQACSEERWKDGLRALKKVLSIDPFYRNGEAAALRLLAEKRLREIRRKLPQEILHQLRHLLAIFNSAFTWFRRWWKIVTAIVGILAALLSGVIIPLLSAETGTPLAGLRDAVINYLSGDNSTSITLTLTPRLIGESQFYVNSVMVKDIGKPYYVDARQISIEVRVRDTTGEPISPDEILCQWTFDPPFPDEAIEEESGCQISYQIPEKLNSQLVEVLLQGKDKIAGKATSFINIILQSDEGVSNEQ
jgi:serine/threonine protein kinase